MRFFERVVAAIVRDHFFETHRIIDGALARGALGRKALERIGADNPWIRKERLELLIRSNSGAAGDEGAHRGPGKNAGQKALLGQSLDDSQVEKAKRSSPREQERRTPEDVRRSSKAGEGELGGEPRLIGVRQVLDASKRFFVEGLDQMFGAKRCSRVEPRVRQLAEMTVQGLSQQRHQLERLTRLARAGELFGVLAQKLGVVDRRLGLRTPGLRIGPFSQGLRPAPPRMVILDATHPRTHTSPPAGPNAGTGAGAGADAGTDTDTGTATGTGTGTGTDTATARPPPPPPTTPSSASPKGEARRNAPPRRSAAPAAAGRTTGGGGRAV